MKIHKEGFATIVICTVLFLAINLVSFYYLERSWISWLILIATFGLLVFILSFFRIPRRLFTEEESSIVAPAMVP